jgi:hypothetical protein
MHMADVHTEERSLGPWRIEHKVIDTSDPSVGLNNLRAQFSPGGRGYIPSGTYVGLIHERRGLVMSDTPDERRDHNYPVMEAWQRGGRVLLHGLGIGMVLNAILAGEKVEHVDVVEIDQQVIDLVMPSFTDERITIHHDDCLTKRWPPGSRWQVVWHDIWDHLIEDNLPTMHRLHRSFGRRADWQGSWGRAFLEWQLR